MGIILNTPTKDDIFSQEDVESGINKLANDKAKDIEGYQDEISKLENLSSFLISTRFSIWL